MVISRETECFQSLEMAGKKGQAICMRGEDRGINHLDHETLALQEVRRKGASVQASQDQKKPGLQATEARKNVMNKQSLIGKDTALMSSGYTGTLQICDHKHPWHPLERMTPSSSDVHRYLLLQDQEQNQSH